jgi:hypothetical protein
MKHLSRAELVDFIEASPRMPAGRARHVSTCDECRAKADALRSMRALAATDEIPEPSPLFWDHFSARVADAVREETPGEDAAAGMRWPRAPLVTWAAAATMAVLVMMTVVWRTTLHAPAPAMGPATAGTAAAGKGTVATGAEVPASEESDIDADEAWAVVRAAAQDLRWEEAHAAGLSAHPGSAEGLALELTADERFELARLLDAGMREKGTRQKG